MSAQRCDVLLQHQALRHEFTRRRDDGGLIFLFGPVTFRDWRARIAGRGTLRRGFRKRDIAALEAPLNTVAMAMRTRVPAGICAQRSRHHRRAYAGNIVAVTIDRRHQHGVLQSRTVRVVTAMHERWRLCQDTLVRLRAEIQQRQRVWRRERHHTGNCRELPPPCRVIDQRVVGSGRDATVRRALAIGGPRVHRVEQGAEEHRGGDVVGVMPADAR